VLDSQEEVYERNLISWNELISYFKDCIDDIPLIIAFNKQDLPDKFNPRDFLREIDFDKHKNMDSRFTIAVSGEGILDCFEDVLRLILRKFMKNRLISAVN
jgi:hypothetical protein